VCHVYERREMYAEFLLRNLKETDHLEDLGIEKRVILKWILKNRM